MSWSDPGLLSVDACLARIAALEKAKARIDARQAQYLARLIEHPDPIAPEVAAHSHNPRINQARLEQISVTGEVACLLHISYEVASERMHHAHRLVHDLPDTLAAVRAGEIPYQHGVQLVRATKDLDQTVVAKVEKQVLAKAAAQTASEFRRAVKRAVAAYDPRGTSEKHETAAEQRRVCYQPDEDGMAWVSAYLTAHDAQTVQTAIQLVADKLRADAGPDDDRTADQFRADALVAVCQAVLGGHNFGRLPTWQGRHPQVQVAVAMSTLLGLDDQPGELAGYGPIDADTARRLAGDPTSTWYRLVHDDLGRLVDYGRTRYRPPQDLTDFVTARDTTCRAPGCNRPARRCELDHVQDWADGGQTNANNLEPRCARHHHLKHDAGWHTERLADGTSRWTAPSGRVYDKPPDELPKDTTHEARPQDPDPPPPF